MDFKGEIASRFVRIIAIIALLVGLGDAARLLGVTSGSASPLAELGPAGFVYLAVFCLARLFAAVGLWIRASWGAVLLVGATTVELVMFLAGNRDVHLDAIGFAIRLLLVVAIVLLFVLSLRMRRAHD
ncbi:MAG TPA: hypothetical protein GYA10_07795 [Alphaproteobacteria bacterium]|nr:hypothetical protein [Alphaproteobacteria bacterium]